MKTPKTQPETQLEFQFGNITEKTKLFTYQKEGANWLTRAPFRLLADGMGLGKSAQAISALDILDPENKFRVLILCPAVARINWLREFQKFSAYKRPISIREKGAEENISEIVSYDFFTRNLSLFNSRKWDVLILDEAHFLKEPKTKRTAAVFGALGVAHTSKRVWALTGTPAPSHAGELWMLLYAFGVTSLRHRSFIEEFCTYFETGFHRIQITGTRRDRISEINQMLSKIMLRRRVEDVLTELPPITIENVLVDTDSALELPPDIQEKIEREHKLLSERLSFPNEITLTHENTHEMFLALEALAQSVSTLRRYSGIQKIKAVSQMVCEELGVNAYQKIVIFGIHRDVIESLTREFKDFGCVSITGSTPARARQNAIDRFQNDPACRVFIGNILAAGTAITLTAANQVLFVEQDWVPGNNEQALKRCHRIGQKSPVFVRFVALSDSIDERITEIIRRKTKELALMIDSGAPNHA